MLPAYTLWTVEAVSVQLEMGSTPAPGVATRRPRGVAGEGASHGARGGRAPLPLNRYR